MNGQLIRKLGQKRYLTMLCLSGKKDMKIVRQAEKKQTNVIRLTLKNIATWGQFHTQYLHCKKQLTQYAKQFTPQKASRKKSVGYKFTLLFHFKNSP